MTAGRPRVGAAAWPAERCARFAADWEAGLSGDALREKYGVASAGQVAAKLRKKGLALSRRTGERPL